MTCPPREDVNLCPSCRKKPRAVRRSRPGLYPTCAACAARAYRAKHPKGPAPRPASVTCACGASLTVKTGGGPLPSKCSACKEKAKAPSKARAQRRRRALAQCKRRAVRVELAQLASDVVRGRLALQQRFEDFRAQVHALVRDLGLPHSEATP